jgi:phage terminase large subunit-like protein
MSTKDFLETLIATVKPAETRDFLTQQKKADVIHADIGIHYDWSLWARPKQLPPQDALRSNSEDASRSDSSWHIWLLLAGRGFGKTLAITQWALAQAKAMPGSRGALVAATERDARDVLVEGESGILNVAPPDFMPKFEPSKRRLTFPNGSTAALFSAEKPNRLRGPQHHWAICDELAAWTAPEAFDMLLLGLRLGDDPRVAVATTPRPVALIKRLLADSSVAVVRGSTYENRANLAPTFFAGVARRYEGTSLGRQELLGEVLDENAGALFKRHLIEAARVAEAPELKRIVVAIDPAVTSHEGSDETGIVVAGVAEIENMGHVTEEAYVLDDLSLKASPHIWASEAVAAYQLWQADRIVAEVNNGGDLVEHTVRTVDANAPYRAVRASRGKNARAEPVAALYEQGKVHHVGVFATLEQQMCEGAAKSPDRVDALVWALSALMLEGDTAVVMRKGKYREKI